MVVKCHAMRSITKYMIVIELTWESEGRGKEEGWYQHVRLGMVDTGSIIHREGKGKELMVI